ncbi:MAG: serine/threonine protein kinase [Phycisphaerales bacterium]|nr:serine/threonine protein kinase [Phycisphaerales bacterium]
MTACPPIERWAALVAGTAPDRADLDRHAKTCAACSRLLADLVRNELLADDLRAVLAGHPVRAMPQVLAGQLGGFRITRILGSGGMATVYEAEQDHPRRAVALKVLARGLNSRAALARFRQEAEILARLHHHGIAQVYAAGTDGQDARPYFAMELLRGRTLLEHAADLDRRARLELLARVCDAVHYAHDHGVVHRDLKPSNIIVDEHGQPKVLDFGVARPMEPGPTAAHTEPGLLVGTLAYMSPEQAAGEPARAQADVYALGVILYELLAGRLPLDLTSASAVAALRIIQEREPLRLGHVDRALRGDLEAVTAAAMAKDPDRRYATAAALAADLRRHLDGVPVAARPPSALYHLRLFARRNRLLVAASGAVFVALAAGLAGTTYGLVRAERRRQTAESVSGLLESALRAANPHEVKGAGYTVRQLLDDISRNLDERLAGQPEVEAQVRSTIGNAYRLLGDYPRARDNLQAALDLRNALQGAGHPKVAAALSDLAWVRHDQADYPGAERLFTEALTVSRQALGPRHAQVAAALHGLSDVQRHEARFNQAQDNADLALSIRRELPGPNGSETAESLMNLSKLARDRGDVSASERFLDEAMTAWEAIYGAEHPRLVDGLNDRAWLQFLRRDLDGAKATLSRALEMGRRLLGPAHPDVANTLYELGEVQQAAGDAAAAEASLREALGIYRAAHGNDHPSVWTTLDAIAQLLIRVRGDYAGAEPLIREALEGRSRLFGEAAGETALSVATLARLYRSTGRLDEAEEAQHRALSALRLVYGPDRSYIAISEHELGLIAEERSQPDRAEAPFRESLRINTLAFGNAHPDTLFVATALARSLNAQGRFTEALTTLAPFIKAARDLPPTWRLGTALEQHAAAQIGLGHPAEAEAGLLEAEDVLAATAGPRHPRTLAVLERRAALYDARSEGEKADALRAEIAARKR